MSESYDFTPQPRAPRSAQVEEGVYLAKLVRIGEKRQKVYKPGDDPSTIQDYIFEITAAESDEDVGKELAYEVNPNINMGYLDGAKKSKLYKVLSALLGINPEQAGRFTSDDLIGRSVKLVITNTASAKGSIYSNISNFIKDTKQTPFEAKAYQAAENESDDPPIGSKKEPVGAGTGKKNLPF